MDSLKRDMAARLGRIETRIAVDDVRYANIAARLKAIEDTLKWLMRLVIGAVVLAGVTYALQGGLIGA